MLNGFFVDIIPAATPGNANFTSDAVNGLSYSWVAVQVVATSLDTGDGALKLQDSLDGTNWNDIPGVITVGIGASSNMIRYTTFTGAYIRVVWLKGTNTTGTLTGKLLFKK